MRLLRGADGELVLLLPLAWVRRLESLPERLATLLDRPETAQSVSRRLFPRFSDDPALDAELRELNHQDLARRKREQAEAFATALRAHQPLFPRWRRITLRPEQVEAWIGFLNDLRLFLGVVLDLQDNAAAERLARQSPPVDSDAWLYLFLTELQGHLIAAADAEAT
jgi:hypothetical protein